MRVFKKLLNPLTLKRFYPHLASLQGWVKTSESSYILLLDSKKDPLYKSFEEIIKQITKVSDIISITLSHVPPLSTTTKEYSKGRIIIGQLTPDWDKDWGSDIIYQRQSLLTDSGSFILLEAPCTLTEKGANQLCMPKINVFIELT